MTAPAIWRYDARDYATRPELCVEFVEPPVFVWASADEWADTEDDPAAE